MHSVRNLFGAPLATAPDLDRGRARDHLAAAALPRAHGAVWCAVHAPRTAMFEAVISPCINCLARSWMEHAQTAWRI